MVDPTVSLWQHQQKINERIGTLLKANAEFIGQLSELVIELTDEIMKISPETAERLTALLDDYRLTVMSATLLLNDPAEPTDA